MGENYRGQSFGPIAAYAEHGAIVHYSATPETDKEIINMMISGQPQSC